MWTKSRFLLHSWKIFYFLFWKDDGGDWTETSLTRKDNLWSFQVKFQCYVECNFFFKDVRVNKWLRSCFSTYLRNSYFLIWGCTRCTPNISEIYSIKLVVHHHFLKYWRQFGAPAISCMVTFPKEGR